MNSFRAMLSVVTVCGWHLPCESFFFLHNSYCIFWASGHTCNCSLLLHLIYEMLLHIPQLSFFVFNFDAKYVSVRFTHSKQITHTGGRAGVKIPAIFPACLSHVR